MLFFCGRIKTGAPREKPLKQGRVPTTNSTNLWRQLRESNPGHNGGRRVFSLLRHPCLPDNRNFLTMLNRHLPLFLWKIGERAKVVTQAADSEKYVLMTERCWATKSGATRAALKLGQYIHRKTVPASQNTRNVPTEHTGTSCKGTCQNWPWFPSLFSLGKKLLGLGIRLRTRVGLKLQPSKRQWTYDNCWLLGWCQSKKILWIFPTRSFFPSISRCATSRCFVEGLREKCNDLSGRERAYLICDSLRKEIQQC